MLTQILEATRNRLPGVIADLDRLRKKASDAGPGLSLAAALADEGLSVIAEVKRRSPTVGDIAPGLDPADLAAHYQRGGAAAVSVLTEPEFFGGSLGDLAAVRRAVDLPVLRKDFVLHPAQVWEARAAGADAILLIAAVLDLPGLESLLATAAEAGLEALVEAHDADEAVGALRSGAQIVGVNNRDLTTFDVDLATAERVRSALGDGVVTVAESGVGSLEGATRMRRAGYDAILVGEAAVKSSDAAAFVASLREAA